MKANPIKLILSVLVCGLAGVIGSIFTTPSIPTWYATLNKPFFNPPNFLFGPVWTILFLMMGISLYLILESKNKIQKKKAVAVFASQLFLNVIWSLIFFGLKSPFYAFVEIIILWIAILVTIFEFHEISKPASYLLIPYLLWVTFATLLNYSIWILN